MGTSSAISWFTVPETCILLLLLIEVYKKPLSVSSRVVIPNLESSDILGLQLLELAVLARASGSRSSKTAGNPMLRTTDLGSGNLMSSVC